MDSPEVEVDQCRAVWTDERLDVVKDVVVVGAEERLGIWARQKRGAIIGAAELWSCVISAMVHQTVQDVEELSFVHRAGPDVLEVRAAVEAQGAVKK